MSTWCILLAAGSGTRLQAATAGRPKQFLELDGRPLYWRSALTLRTLPELAGLVFVAPAAHLPAMEEEIRRLWVQDALNLPWRIVAGGARRQDSVRHGLHALPDTCARVLIHDSARPFASAALVRRLLEAMDRGAAAVIPAIAVTDTVKEVEQHTVLRTLDRSRLRAVQTPQAFALPLLRQAHARAEAEGWEATDDASLVEALGEAVVIVPGEETNMKITTPQDLELLRQQTSPLLSLLPVSGWGYDVHKYAEPHEPKARPMKLGGVPIPKAPCVLAHSDGDVLLHALVDALAALVCAGDIGTRFPDTDPAFENMPSAIFVHELLQDVWGAGILLTHVDLTIIAQVPKVGPYREAIRKHVAQLLKLEPGQVNVKATTEEGLGFTGEKKGIKAVAMVSALRPAAGLAPDAALE
ncbi:2-C-methyl-D-erythritol 4-phosphate cytidylyltransferase [Megalodesulfovibrio gigas]|uniref:Bifunctional enzyme IspD/IspF n=1 Tax=Megalodesulfovibrio gigas (strain ATCC 19364 / DSM 1382 / NCIMB 9332 / VKM B-1759) TaxID=1121448 RepID=T2GEA2_MEGG1|nr:2-C-methyl-D-erythritol 4-phosphate cytidylyltransferase [Megalodesulfovibrio gigas]AGW14514.1 putative YgbB family protein [Megalodesulfovibrio gigas DSM 1382 = ATCC 19364]